MHDKTTRQRRRGRRASPGTLVELHAVSMHVAAMASPLPLVLGEGRGRGEHPIVPRPDLPVPPDSPPKEPS